MARLHIFYDGRCHLCSREIAHYRKKAVPGTSEFVDISAATFDPVAEGFDPVRVRKHMHARLDGTLFIGLDAFRAVWFVIPGFRWLRTLTGLPVVYQLAKLSYALFARVRPFLPKRKPCGPAGCPVADKPD